VKFPDGGVKSLNVVPMRSGSGLDVGIRGDVSPNRWPQRRSVGGSMGKTSVWS